MAHLGGFSEDALKLFQEAASEQGFDFSEMGDTYDFTRCVRPDGSAYGTGGRCRLGSEEAKAPSEKKPRVRTAGKKMSEMTTEERRAAIEKRFKARVQELKRLTDSEVKQKYVDTLGMRYPTNPKAFPGKQTMAQAIAREELKKDSALVEKRAKQEKGPQGQENLKMARELIDRGAKENNDMLIKGGADIHREANKEINREIKESQDRARKLQDAGARLHKVEMDLRNKTNKMDMGYEKDDPKVRERLARVQEAQKKVNKMRDQNIRYRQQVEGPLRERLNKANEDMERLASEIRRNEGPARAQQMDNVRAKIMEITRLRKRLNEGPGFSPDLGGKGGEPLNISKLYDSLNID